MNLIELIIWLVGIFPTIAFWARLDGKAKSREADQSVTDHPPYLAGVLTAWAWPLQLLIGGGYLTYKAFDTMGRSDGIMINEALVEHRANAAITDRVTKQLIAGEPLDRVIQEATEDIYAPLREILAVRGITLTTHTNAGDKKDLEL